MTVVVQRMVRCFASQFGFLLIVSLALQACGSVSTPGQGAEGRLSLPNRQESSGGRAQRLVASVRPQKAEPYFGSITAFAVHVSVAADERARKNGDWISEEEAGKRLEAALRTRGVRVVDQASATKGAVANVNLSLELSVAPEARRYGYRLSVTDDNVDPSMAFDQSVKAHLRHRRTGSISIEGQGGKEADLGLIDSIAVEIVQLVPKEKRAEPSGLAEGGLVGPEPKPNPALADAFIVRTRFDLDPVLTARRGYWTAGSARAYLEKLLRDRGLHVVDSPRQSPGAVAYIEHGVKGKANERQGSDGFDYRYETSFSVTQDYHAFLPGIDSHDKGTGEFVYFEDSERLDLEKFANELARAYRGSGQAQ